jgi:hypothetical protein
MRGSLTICENMIDVGHSSEVQIPNPRLGDQVNRNIIHSETEGGVYLRNLPVEAKLHIQTENRLYTLINRGRGEALLCGHPEFCPRPVAVMIHGSTWGGSMLKTGFLGRGMRLEFQHPDYEKPILTSRIVELRHVQ